MAVHEGIANLVNQCAEVKRGEKVLVLNARGEVEADLAELIVEAVRSAGGQEQVMWLDPPEGRGGPGGAPTLSDELIGAIRGADKVIALYPLSDRALVEALGESPNVLIANTMFRTKEHFGLEHARYHWGMADAIYQRFENELFAEGRRFRLANPAGTDVSGVIGPFSERARQLDEYRVPFSRSFNSPAYIPVATTRCEGQAVIGYTGGFQRIPIDHPPTIVIENNVIDRVEGPPEAQRWVEEYAKMLDERAERLARPNANRVDSWHGGLHPTAECTGGPRGLIGNASTDMAHFHIGPDGAHGQLQWGRTTLELDGETVIENGKYHADFDDPKLRETARRFGLAHWK
jgi:hypothetical protein